MNETLGVIKSRRSIRRYRPEQIAERELETILESALYAPSAMNEQKWHFTVIQDKHALEQMVATIKENMANSGVDFLAQRASDPAFSPFHHAPTVVLISADARARFAKFDCAAAAQNIALAAESLGIGSCIIAMSDFLFASEKGKELGRALGIPDGYEHVCAVALGYADGPHPPAPPRKRDVVNYVR